MFRKKIAIICCCAIAASGLGSCVTTTDEYDSLKDLSLDMKIAPDGMSIPLGSLAKIRLDSLIKVKENGMITVLDGGTFGITKNQSISETSVNIDDLTLNFPNPILESAKAEFDLGTDVNITHLIHSDISISSEISLDESVDPSLVKVDKVNLASPAVISIKLLISNIPDGAATASIENFLIPFPAFMKLSLVGSNPGVSLNGSTVMVSKDLSPEERINGVQISLTVDSLDFNPAVIAANGRIKLSETINVSGKVSLDCVSVPASQLKNIEATPTVTIAPLAVSRITGLFNPQIRPVNENVKLNLGSDLDFLKNAGNNMTLSNPTITLDLNSTLTAPLKMNLALSSKDSKGQYIAQNVTPDQGAIILPACPIDQASKKTVLVLNCNRQTDKGDTLFVKISRLGQLMTTIPDNISFNLSPSFDQNATQTIDLTRDLKVSGSYSVKVPLAFNDMRIEYSDTIKDMGKDLKNIGEKIVSTKVKLTGKITSSLPLKVDISATPKNSNNQTVDGIAISSLSIPASANASGFELNVNVTKTGALKDLDKIILKAVCTSNTPVELKKDQYLHVTDLVLKIPDGINFDFSEKDKK